MFTSSQPQFVFHLFPIEFYFRSINEVDNQSLTFKNSDLIQRLNIKSISTAPQFSTFL